MNIIWYPEHVSEGTIQAEIYRRLKNNNIDVQCEVIARIHKRKCRFDLVVFINSGAMCIIECKAYKTRRKIAKSSKQMKLYSQFNIPVFQCCNSVQIDETIANVTKLVQAEQD